jgi:hypothetical protein
MTKNKIDHVELLYNICCRRRGALDYWFCGILSAIQAMANLWGHIIGHRGIPLLYNSVVDAT